MRLIEFPITVNSRQDVVSIYPLGDIHLGALACAEGPLRRVVREIRDDPLAYWFGGGDMCEYIKPQDLKRFGFDILPDWILAPNIKGFVKSLHKGDFDDDAKKVAKQYAKEIRDNLNNLCRKQLHRLVSILEPISGIKCIGMLEGNHERALRKHHNEDYHGELCEQLGVENLTDEAMIRLKFKGKGLGASLNLYIRHGYGGGRKAGSEPNKLADMLAEWEDADICFSGHTHTPCIVEPKPVLYMPRRGRVPEELLCRYRHAANWGCWVYSHATGPGSYVSNGCYPARPMTSCRACIQPFYHRDNGTSDNQMPRIEIRRITL